MKVVRPIRHEDLESFEKIAAATGIGMTSIPKNREALIPLIENSLASFKKSVNEPMNESYLFVLEDTENQEIGGVCRLFAKTGVDEPVYFYRLESKPPPTTHFPTPHRFLVLNPIEQRFGPSELCSLYLMPSFRKEGLGKLLSFSRFLFIASFPKRFDEMIYAELRGYIDQNNESPFWNGLGRYFLHISFAELNDHLNGRRNFFKEGLPEYPIYKMLLSQQAQNMIQKTHKNTKSALKMLLEEGFSLSDRINPIDAGPIVEASVACVRSIRESCLARVKSISNLVVNGKVSLVSNGNIEYRSCLGKVKIFKDGQVTLGCEMAKVLNIESGDHVRYISF